MKNILCVLFFSCLVVCTPGFAATGISAATKNTSAAAEAVKVAGTGIEALNQPSTASVKTDTDALLTKHLFLPEAYSSMNKSGPAGKNQPLLKIFQIAKKQLVFSGVISSDRGRKALILNRRSKDPAKRRHSIMLGKGDTIMDLSIEDVGPNFVVLASQGRTMRLNLYEGKKNRPRPIPQIKTSTQFNVGKVSTNNKRSNMAKNIKTMAKNLTNKVYKKRAIARTKTAETTSANRTKVFTKANNPFINAVKKGNTTTTKGTNPFIEAIRKAMEKK